LIWGSSTISLSAQSDAGKIRLTVENRRHALAPTFPWKNSYTRTFSTTTTRITSLSLQTDEVAIGRHATKVWSLLPLDPFLLPFLRPSLSFLHPALRDYLLPTLPCPFFDPFSLSRASSFSPPKVSYVLLLSHTPVHFSSACVDRPTRPTFLLLIITRRRLLVRRSSSAAAQGDGRTVTVASRVSRLVLQLAAGAQSC